MTDAPAPLAGMCRATIGSRWSAHWLLGRLPLSSWAASSSALLAHLMLVQRPVGPTCRLAVWPVTGADPMLAVAHRGAEGKSTRAAQRTDGCAQRPTGRAHPAGLCRQHSLANQAGGGVQRRSPVISRSCSALSHRLAFQDVSAGAAAAFYVAPLPVFVGQLHASCRWPLPQGAVGYRFRHLLVASSVSPPRRRISAHSAALVEFLSRPGMGRFMFAFLLTLSMCLTDIALTLRGYVNGTQYPRYHELRRWQPGRSRDGFWTGYTGRIIPSLSSSSLSSPADVLADAEEFSA